MDDREAHEFYADPANRELSGTPRKRRGPPAAHCPHCLDGGEVCEGHPAYPAHIKTEGHEGDRCGQGMPCPACCSPITADGTHPISEAFTPDWLRPGSRP